MQEGNINKKEALEQLRSSYPSVIKLDDEGRKLSSGLSQLDQALQGGFNYGSLCEWGLPPGKQGRQVLLKFLAHNKPLCLWIYPGMNEVVYPPTWQAYGVDLDRTYFIQSTAPVRDLRAVFLERAFDIIVIDSPKICSREEQSFIKKQARDLAIVVFILRPFLLKHERGNPFAKFRLNTSFDEKNKNLTLDILRGSRPLRLKISIDKQNSDQI